MRSKTINAQALAYEWSLSAPIADALPVDLGGGSVIPALGLDCPNCNRPMEGSHIRGNVVLIEPGVCSIEGVGACGICEMLTVFSFRCTGDRGTVIVEWHEPSGRRLVHVRPTLWLRCLRHLKKRIGLYRIGGKKKPYSR